MKYRIRFAVVLTIAALNPSVDLFGQSPEDPMASPTEQALRFTPEMAGSMGHMVSRQIFSRYELPEEQYDEAANAVAGRLMEWAHQFDTPEYRDNVENMLAEMLDIMADYSGPGRRPGMMVDLARSFARNVRPGLAPFQETVNRMARDIRPMLPMKQQLRLAADLTTFGAAFDAFEERVKQWENGDVDPTQNPFQPADEQIRLNEQGISNKLEQARRRADRMMEQGPHTQWGSYLKRAIAYYELDEAQQASAHALLRDYEQRAAAIMRNEQHLERKQRLLLWRTFWAPMTQGNEDTVSLLIAERLDEVDAPLRQLDAEFKRRVDEIPTDAQRQAARQHAWELLAENGLSRELLEEMTAGTKQAAGPEQQDIQEVQP